MNRTLILLTFLFLAAGCKSKTHLLGKPGPGPETQSTLIYRLNAYPWKLVETSDPTITGLSPVTFLIFNFGSNFNGDIKKVLNNTQYDTPVKTFVYTDDQDEQRVRMQLTTPGVDGEESSVETIDYLYSFSSSVWLAEIVYELVLVDSARGYSYRFVSMAEELNLIGYAQCDGTMGSFDLFVVRSLSQPGKYELSLKTLEADTEGDIAQAVAANAQENYVVLEESFALQNGATSVLGYLTEEEMDTLNILSIASYQPGVDFPSQTPAKQTLCEIPRPD